MRGGRLAHADRPRKQLGLRQGLGRVCGFKEEPVEWVYTGLPPLLLHDVLQSKKGVSAPLAVLTSCVAYRLGVPLLPAPPSASLGAGARSVGAPLACRSSARRAAAGAR